ncbi:uncharacterized protein N7498_003661 [Penicillium cinerascens]|uniref:Uncharacterized protein n=1 Tax=Penicillium cinerascens TaxID=70096 RepID=A0A9W9T840_9EURO|nr:uncharacterized protein N7498_003661 [Penicillium cinerascens]KAJ5212015.1 hypothetical protein N7498_003661 [Penicillium cinerascens]
MVRHGHGHYRHSRIGKRITDKHLLEEKDAGIADVEDAKSKLLGAVDPLETPSLSSSDMVSTDHCDPLQNVTCLKDSVDTPNISLSKRQEAESPPTTVVETILQVVDQNSHTLWVSTAADFPMTISNPAFGAFTFTGSETASAELSLSTTPTNLLATPPATSTTQTTPLPTSKQIQTAPISSPKISPASSSVPCTSTPLFPPSNSTTVLPTTTSSGYYGGGGGYASSSSWEGPYSSTTSYASTSVSGGSEETGTGTGSGAEPSKSNSQPSSGSGSGSGSSNDATTPKIVGGVLGSVAGLAVLFLLLFYLFRRRKFLQQKSAQALPSEDAGARGMSERTLSNDNDLLFSPSYLAPAFMRRWRNSTMTTATASSLSSSNTSERGFQKLSGRKIPPVLTHGGDGFGGGLDGDSPTVPGFSPMSPGGGPLSSPSTYGPPPASPFGMPLDTNLREADENITPTRPSPVHLPVSSSVNFGSPTTVIPSHTLAQPQSVVPVLPARPDGLGRSHPSHDGSRGSRFTESLDL